MPRPVSTGALWPKYSYASLAGFSVFACYLASGPVLGYGFLSPLGFYQVNIPSQHFLRVLSRSVLAFVVHGRYDGRTHGSVRLCFSTSSECSANRMHSLALLHAYDSISG